LLDALDELEKIPEMTVEDKQWIKKLKR